MSRNVVTVLIVLCLVIGFKGAEWIYYRVAEVTVDIDDKDWEERQLANRQAIQKLALGDPLSKVSSMMGTADFNVMKPSDAGLYQVLYYRTHHLKEDGRTTKDECTPLVFRDQLLVGWGHEFFEFTFGSDSSTEGTIEN